MKERKNLRLEEKKRKREELELIVDDKADTDFNPDLTDSRFKKVFENSPQFAIDPVDPNFDHRRIGKVFAEVVRKNKGKGREW